MTSPWEDSRTAANGMPVRANFAQWFGKSIARDEAGLPRMLFHGAGADFDVFRPSRGGEYGSGIYLTEDPGSAWMYAQRSASSEGHVCIIPVYARLQNPFIATSRDWVRSVGVKGLKARGFDGIIGIGVTGERQLIAFDPCQVKSAFGNCGLYLTNSDSLTDWHAGQDLAASQRAARVVEKADARPASTWRPS